MSTICAFTVFTFDTFFFGFLSGHAFAVFEELRKHFGAEDGFGLLGENDLLSAVFAVKGLEIVFRFERGSAGWTVEFDDLHSSLSLFTAILVSTLQLT